MSAFEEGMAAYNDGVNPDNNPYPPHQREHSEWIAGWEAAAECEEEI